MSNGVTANPENVQILTNAMIAAFEATYNAGTEGQFQFVDGIMAGHNLHKALVLDVLERSKPTKHQRYALLAGVRETWIRAIDELIRRRANG